jgi:DUF2075 family protein
VNITNYREFDKINKTLGLGNEGTELDWILAHSQHQVLFYDAAQTIRPTDIRRNQFEYLLAQGRHYNQYDLTSQMRSLGGQDYINYVKDIFNCKPNLVKLTFGEYEFRLFDSIKELYCEIRKNDEEIGLSRMVAGYGWKWISKGKSLDSIEKNDLYDIRIQGEKYVWNTTNQDWVNSVNALNEIGCIHTTQGYDLNYVGVIMGNELKYDPDKNQMIIDKKNYFDRNGLSNIVDDQELKDYILNIYITLFCRGIKGTYVYVCDDNLRNYLKAWLS